MIEEIPLSSDWTFGSTYYRAWYAIEYIDRLKPGSVATYTVCDREVVLFRTSAGRVAAVDPYCPHLGAHLGQGDIVGELLECPFHGWRFDRTGQVTGDALVDRSGCHLTTWRIAEANGQIYVWYSPDGVEPTYQPTDFNDGTWGRPVGRRRWLVRAELSDIFENAVDPLHFEKVHKIGRPTCSKVHAAAGTVAIEADQEFHAKVFGRTADSFLRMRLHDPGTISSVISRVGSEQQLTISSLVPVGPDHVLFRFEIRARREAPVVSRWFLPHVIAILSAQQLKRDMAIWALRRRPEICAYTSADADIVAVRRWLLSFQASTAPMPPKCEP